jgi:hypothetical protein
MLRERRMIAHAIMVETTKANGRLASMYTRQDRKNTFVPIPG